MNLEEEMKVVRQELVTLRKLVSEGLNALRNAESEVPESMRRFITYMHDLHDVCYMYESRGLPVPEHVHREMERCDDRYRQLLDKQFNEGGTFDRIRREMAADPLNKWDHTRLLTKKENGSEAGTSKP